MKKNLLILASILVLTQNTEAQDYFSSASDFASLYVGAVEPQYQTSLWHDCPYYNDHANMYQGRVSYHGVVYDNVQLRFDQFEQRVVVLSPVGLVYCLPEQKYIDWFEMDGHRYVHDPEDSTRYASLLCDGSINGIRLYHCVWKDFCGEKLLFGEKRYLKTLSTEEYYTLITADGERHYVKRASDIAKIIPEQKRLIRQIAKQNHLSFSKNERERSLVKVVEGIPGVPYREPERQQLEDRPTIPSPSVTPIDDKMLISGIPVIDTDTITTGSVKTTTYIIPGVKKARASVSDDQELAEIVVVAGR